MSSAPLGDANLLAAAVKRDPEIDCGVLFQYCDLREIYGPLEYLNVALQYDDLPYRKWSSPLDFNEIGIDGLTPHEACASSSAGNWRAGTPRATAAICPSRNS